MNMVRSALAAAALAVGVGAAPGAAQEWVLGADITRFQDRDARRVLGATLEVHGAPRWSLGKLDTGFGVAASLDDRSNAWVGGGVSALVPIGQDWYGEASVMPGFYSAGGSATDLGHRLQLRSLIGLGYILNRDTSLSLALSHRSNFGLGSANPGANTLSLRLRRGF